MSGEMMTSAPGNAARRSAAKSLADGSGRVMRRRGGIGGPQLLTLW